MGILSRLFKKTAKVDHCKMTNPIPEQVDSLFVIDKQIQVLLLCDKYIARSNYRDITNEYDKIVHFFKVLESSNLISEFCQKHNLNQHLLITCINKIDNLAALVEVHNNDFVHNTKIKEKAYLDSILKDIDPLISLDENQREVVLTDEDYCLVIAGAGAGKTTTVAAKVKYLVEKKDIDPKQILVISFTNKAVDELKEKINRDLAIDCPITTFHATGNAVIRKNNDAKLNIFDSNKLYYVLKEYFQDCLISNKELINNMILFFGSYFESASDPLNFNSHFVDQATKKYETIKSDLNDVNHEITDSRSKKLITITNEILRSQQEVDIANYLYLNNIEYKYEPIYQYNIKFSNKPYTPDFIIKQDDKTCYIEHFGITESGESNRYSSDQLELYKKTINDKIRMHKKHGTLLIHTFSQYNDGRTIVEHLKEELISHGFEMSQRAQEEVIGKLINAEQSRYFSKYIDLISRFINNFKANAYGIEDFSKMSQMTSNVRSKLFLEITKSCYLAYQRFLAENNAVDFQDMINESVKILNEVKLMNEKLDFKYIIVDEYQDISRQRFDLTKALADVTNSKIIAVGDDWQSIYAFSGSDITLFTQFCKIMGYGKQLNIVNTYRNAQEVIDIAGNFIQKNTNQIKKALISPKNIKDPVIIYTYDSTLKKPGEGSRSGSNYAVSKATEIALDNIVKYNSEENKSQDSTVLLIGRFGFDGVKLEQTGLFQFDKRKSKLKSIKYPKMNIIFMTAHSSKGLGYDNVIVINGKNETYGFPAKIEDDPVLKFVLKHDDSIDYAEERRLFYVALTRTKNRVFIIAPKQNPSEFLLEIKKDYKNVVLEGDWDEQKTASVNKKICPICGFPLQYRYKNSYGLRLNICTNEPEICGFMTNDIRGKKISILKCNQCESGYLVVKRKGDGKAKPFMGCTNYLPSGKGCNNSMTMETYYSNYSLTDDCETNSFNENADENPVNKVAVNSSKNDKSIDEIKKNEEIEDINMSTLSSGKEYLATIQVIIACITQISELHFFGKNLILDILRGAINKKILQYKFDQIPTYGRLKHINREELEIAIDWLIKKGFLYQREGMYPVIHLTHKSNSINTEISESELTALKRAIQLAKKNEK